MIEIFVTLLVGLMAVFAAINIVQGRMKAVLAPNKPRTRWVWDRMIAKRIVFYVQGGNVYATGPLGIKVWVCAREDVDDAHRTALYQMRRVVRWLKGEEKKVEPVYSVRDALDTEERRGKRATSGDVL